MRFIMYKTSPAHSSKDNLVREYLKLLSTFCSLMKDTEIKAVPYREEAPLNFLNLDRKQQEKTIKDFRRYTKNCLAVINNGYSIVDDKQMLWSMMKELSVRPPSTLLQKLEDNIVIEIYDTAAWTQVFRNYRFYSLCSYTLDELLCKPWWELYLRNEEVTEKIFETAKKTCQLKKPEILYYNVGPHSQSEISGPIHVVIENKFTAPLFNKHGYVEYMLNAIKVHKVMHRSGASRADCMFRHAH
ncbi:MAG: hypothetical protein R3B45_16670 [Bdellovibrionota bacterium]